MAQQQMIKVKEMYLNPRSGFFDPVFIDEQGNRYFPTRFATGNCELLNWEVEQLSKEKE